MTTTLAHDLDEIRAAAAELPALSPEERRLLAGRIAEFVRDVAPTTEDFLAEATLREERAAELEAADPEDLERLRSLLADLTGLLAATADELPLGAGYDGPAPEHEP